MTSDEVRNATFIYNTRKEIERRKRRKKKKKKGVYTFRKRRCEFVFTQEVINVNILDIHITARNKWILLSDTPDVQFMLTFLQCGFRSKDRRTKTEKCIYSYMFCFALFFLIHPQYTVFPSPRVLFF